jgi:hypothetical protein
LNAYMFFKRRYTHCEKPPLYYSLYPTSNGTLTRFHHRYEITSVKLPTLRLKVFCVFADIAKDGLIYNIDTKAKCRHLIKLNCICLSELIDWRYSQSCWYFRPSFGNCCPSNLLSGPTFPPSPLPCVKVQYLQRVCDWKGVGGVESCWRPYSAEV